MNSDGTIGLVLAAGTGRRLRPYTDGLPKALVPLPGDTTPLDLILANFAEVGIRDVAVVVGFAAEAVRARRPAFEERYGLTLELVDNDRATTWNNCYSLWCARHLFGQDVLLSNGDTVHPIAVQHALLRAAVEPNLLLATDTVKRLGDEEMKLSLSPAGTVERISKQLDPERAYGEYIGVCRIGPDTAGPLVEALEYTWRRDPNLYYEDGFQELVDRGYAVGVRDIGDLPWIEIDDHADLARAADVLRLMRQVSTRGRPRTPKRG